MVHLQIILGFFILTIQRGEGLQANRPPLSGVEEARRGRFAYLSCKCGVAEKRVVALELSPNRPRARAQSLSAAG